MGNIHEKGSYELINNQSDDVPPTNIVPKIMISQLKMLALDVIKSDNIDDTFKDYDNKTILDYYKSNMILDIFMKNDKKAVKLAHAFPGTNENLMFIYFPVVPVDIIIIMSKKIDFNALNENDGTFLFGKSKVHLENMCKLLESVDTINVNLTNNLNLTFFEELIHDQELRDNNLCSRLIQSLEKRNYNFNRVRYDHNTFLTQMLNRIPDMTFHLAETMKLKSFDITTESRWLYHILTNHLRNINNYVHFMLQRDDYVKLILGLYMSLYIDVWGDKFIVFLRKVSSYNHEKCIECLNYKDENGDTVIHYMAHSHDKNTLQFTLSMFRDELKLDANNEGKTPLMLYNESDLKTLLQ